LRSYKVIKELKGDELVKKVGGRYKLTTMVQKRVAELVKGARPLVPPENKTPLEIAVQEIDEGKIVAEEPPEEEQEE
jgi:DNA-directed RNA polymerase subunit omega